jgi:hypothetical protein
LALTIRHGVAPTTVRAGLHLAADKFTGSVPLGADAPTKTLRKVLGGGGELLELLRSLMFGLLALIIGAALIWVGCQQPLQWKFLAVGAIVLVIGAFFLRAARTAFLNLRTIARS